MPNNKEEQQIRILVDAFTEAAEANDLPPHIWYSACVSLLGALRVTHGKLDYKLLEAHIEKNVKSLGYYNA